MLLTSSWEQRHTDLFLLAIYELIFQTFLTGKNVTIVTTRDMKCNIFLSVGVKLFIYDNTVFVAYTHPGYNIFPLSGIETYAILIFDSKCIETISIHVSHF